MRVPIRLSTAAVAVVGTTVSAILLAGFAVTRSDPDQFPNFGVGLWWAVTTITTVGYGDVVPSSWSGRLVGMVLMFSGIACLALLTAIAASAIVAVKVRSEEEVIERDERDILAAIRNLTQQLNRLERRVDSLNARSRVPYAARGRATSAAHRRTPHPHPVRPPRNYEDEE